MSDMIRNVSSPGNPDSDPTPRQYDLREDPDVCWSAWVFCFGIAVISAGTAIYMLWLGR